MTAEFITLYLPASCVAVFEIVKLSGTSAILMKTDDWIAGLIGQIFAFCAILVILLVPVML